MYNYLDKNTNKTAWLITPSISVHVVSTLLTLVFRIAGIVEPILNGLYRLAIAPFTGKFNNNATLALYEIGIHAQKNILRTLCVPIEFFIDMVVILMEPKFFILTINETMKVNSKHAEAGTIGTKEHRIDLMKTDGVVNVKLLDYQGALHK